MADTLGTALAEREAVAVLADEYERGELTLDQVRARARQKGLSIRSVGLELRRRYHHRVDNGRCRGRLRGHDLCPLRNGHRGACDGRAWNE